MDAASAAAVKHLPEEAPGDAPQVLPWLARQTWLLREHGSGTRATTESFLDSLELTPSTLTVGSNVAVCESVAAGLGVTLISRDAVARELGRGGLVELPTPATPLRRDWRLVSREGRLPGPARLFVQHVLDTGEFQAPRRGGGPRD
jgi:DNA-binding transcriptional LysR family regulator